METVLITGAGGYIGSNAAEYFVRAGYRVVGVVHRKVADRFARLGVKTITADLTDEAAIGRLFDDKPDYVVHIAALASDVGRDEWFRAANYEVVKNLASVSMDRNVKRFVYLSTADVYGLHDFNGESEDELSFDETVTNPYPKYKILSEKWLAATRHSLTLGLARSIREPSLRGGYALQLLQIVMVTKRLLRTMSVLLSY